MTKEILWCNMVIFIFLMCLNNVQWLIEGLDNSLCTYIQFTTFSKKSNLRNVQWLFEVFDILHFATRYDL